jgi:hypothetical protein
MVQVVIKGLERAFMRNQSCTLDPSTLASIPYSAALLPWFDEMIVAWLHPVEHPVEGRSGHLSRSIVNFNVQFLAQSTRLPPGRIFPDRRANARSLLGVSAHAGCTLPTWSHFSSLSMNTVRMPILRGRKSVGSYGHLMARRGDSVCPGLSSFFSETTICSE